MGIPSLEELLDINDVVSSDELLGEMVKDTLREFEHYQPLVLTQRTYITTTNGEAILTDNFQAFLDNNIEEKDINLIPNAIIGISVTKNLRGATNKIRRFDYSNAPVIKELFISSGIYNIRGVFNRPFIEEYDTAGVARPENAIYYLDIRRGQQSARFLDACYMRLLTYIINLKNSLVIPNLPVDLFSQVESEYSRIESVVKTYYDQSMSFSRIIS